MLTLEDQKVPVRGEVAEWLKAHAWNAVGYIGLLIEIIKVFKIGCTPGVHLE